MTAMDQWWYLAAFLPVAIGALIGLYNRLPWTDLTVRAQATIAMVAYFAYALIGSWLDGKFAGLRWETAQDVATSIMAVLIIGHASYQTIYKALPVAQAAEVWAGGDPMVSRVPGQNVV